MPTGLERMVTGEQARTLPGGGDRHALALATCTADRHAGKHRDQLGLRPDGQAWILSSMSLGLAGAHRVPGEGESAQPRGSTGGVLLLGAALAGVLAGLVEARRTTSAN